MFTLAEVTREQKCYNFAAAARGDAWVCAWVHKRGKIDGDSSDGGQDLVVMTTGNAAGSQVIISGAKSLSTPAFDENGRFLVVRNGKELLVSSAAYDQELGVPEEVTTYFTLPSDESFEGAPAWASNDGGADNTILFATSGGAPKRSRLYSIKAPRMPRKRSGSAKQQAQQARRER